MANLVEPCARGIIFVGFRIAADDVFGAAGLARLASLLDVEARRETLERDVLAVEWLPERYVMSWYDAAWNGPARRDVATFARFLDRMLDHGFGRIRRAIVGVIPPHLMLEKAEAFWRHDHTHGEFRARAEGKTATGTLSNHVYTSTPTSRMAITEIYRYCLSLSRARNVKASHSLEGTTLHLRGAWE